jgi:hypothetical protein
MAGLGLVFALLGAAMLGGLRAGAAAAVPGRGGGHRRRRSASRRCFGPSTDRGHGMLTYLEVFGKIPVFHSFTSKFQKQLKVAISQTSHHFFVNKVRRQIIYIVIRTIF